MPLSTVGILTRRKALSEHRRLWRTMAVIAQDVEPTKDEALQRMGYKKYDVIAGCFLCEYARQQRDFFEEGKPCESIAQNGHAFSRNDMCCWCPMKFSNDPDASTPCLADDSIYKELSDLLEHTYLTTYAKVKDRVVELCRKIAEMPSVRKCKE